jgi:hypothetical protein
MLTSRRDYLLRILDEVSRILGVIIFKRRAGADQEALETVVTGLQRLFDLDADQIFLLTPDQHFEMLVDDETPEFARDKVLLYAALNVEAGAIYAKQGNRAMARATRINALRFTLKARRLFPIEDWPVYAPDVTKLVEDLSDEPLDSVTAKLLKTTSPTRSYFAATTRPTIRCRPARSRAPIHVRARKRAGLRAGSGMVQNASSPCTCSGAFTPRKTP